MYRISNMSVTKAQPYEPLDKTELREVEKALNKHCKELTGRVRSQLMQQQRFIDLQRVHVDCINETLADKLRDIADSVETLEDHECDDNNF